jgi:hypothetical protein
MRPKDHGLNIEIYVNTPFHSYRAHVCVSTTAREAHQLGYEVVVAKDAVGDRSIPADGDKASVPGEKVTQVGRRVSVPLNVSLLSLTSHTLTLVITLLSLADCLSPQMVMTELGDFFATIVNSEDIQ